MANEDAPVVKEFKEFGTRRILEMLEASAGGFVDKQRAYDQIVEEFKTQRGWPDELTRLERAVGGTLREVFINRLHWIPARLCGSGLTEPSTNRPFIALPGKLDAALAAYPSCKRGKTNSRSVRPSKTGQESRLIDHVQDGYPEPVSRTDSEPLRQRVGIDKMALRPSRTIVEDVLGQARTRVLWTANYYPVLPFTPQSFEVGALLPTMLYMARFGHRRGKGRFEQVFGRGPNGSVRAPTVNDVAAVLATDRKGDLQGFEDDIGRTVLGDLLLSWCLENRKHVEGQQEQVQRILPTHYFASWVDLPENVTNLRGVPELLTALLARQVDGAWLRQGEPGPFPVGVADLNESRLLALFSRHCAIRGKHAADLASDTFVEDQAHNIGIDELLAVRIALACSNAPHPIGTDGEIANRMPLARRAADGLRDDLSVFVTVYGSQIPRQAFLRMVEAGTGLGLLNLLLSTAAILDEWELTGEVPRVENQSPLPLFVDASQGQDATLRELSEASMTECLRRFERAPILLMLLRVLDDRARNDRRLADKLPPSEPDASDYIRLLGDIYKERHPRSESIFDNLFEDSRRLAAELENDQPEVAERLRQGDPMALAESLCELMGRTLQMNQFLRALESTLMTDKPNGLAVRRRISRTVNGRRRSLDVRSIVLSSAVLDFLVHRHLRDGVDGESSRTLSLHHFLDLLRDRYGLFVDQEPPGQLIPRELLLKNKAWLERRLRDLGLLIGVNDAESMKQLRPRYQGAASHVD